MIKHVVMFRMKENLDAATRLEAMTRFKESIECLPSVIPCIRRVFVGFNVNPNEKGDICLESVFDNLEDVSTYSQHPSHRAAAQALMQHVAERSCVDFVCPDAGPCPHEA